MGESESTINLQVLHTGAPGMRPAVKHVCGLGAIRRSD
jgi:hypothetical protein